MSNTCRHFRSLPKKVVFVALAACFLSRSALCDPQTPISSVLLYPGGATIERTAQIAAGTTQVEFRGLPANFLPETLRARADSGISIAQIVSQEINQPEAVAAREAELQNKIQSLKDRLSLLDVETKSAELVKSYLEHLGGGSAVATDKQQPYIDAKSMSAVLDSLRHNGRDALERIQKSEIQKRDVALQIDSLQRDLAKIKTGTRATRTITVKVAARQAGTVRLSYQIAGAGWKPAYRAALDSTGSSVELERLATLAQKTGEDWKDVQLKLSTNQPRPSLQAPEPQPWLLRYYKPAPRAEPGNAAPMAYKVAPSVPAPASRLRALLATPSEEERKDALPVLENHGEFNTEFTVPGRVNLPSDGREISVNLSRQVMPAKQRVRVSPRQDTSGILTAEASRPEGVWIAGNLQLFRDGSYVGATHWNPVTNDKFVFPFGRDDLIRVVVDRTQERTGSTGFISTQGERKVGYVYTVSSSHKSPIDVLVLEPSPVSTAEEIKVETILQPKPGIETWEGRQGVNGWEIRLAPGQKAKFSAEYTITYPREGTVSNLP